MILRQACIIQILCVVHALVANEAPLDHDRKIDTSLWPVIFLHVPKGGGNFANTIMRTGCSREGVEIKKGWRTRGSGGLLPKGCSRRNFERMSSGHTPLPMKMTKKDAQHTAALFRDPSQRLMSAYFHGRHDCPDDLHRVAPDCKNQDSEMTSPECNMTQKVTAENVERYAECVGACQTRMVNGRWCRGDWNKKKASFLPGDVQRAYDRIANMGFVGLTDEYDLSVCLFHARFGGTCDEAEFANRRPGSRHTNHAYDMPQTERLTELQKDERATYEVAHKRFWVDVKKFGVGRSFCQQLCPHPPEVFGIDQHFLMQNSTLASNFEYDWPGRLSFDVDSED